MVALIPARAGSKRVPGKNTRLLGGVPLFAWTIQAARESGVFEEIALWTDSREIMRMHFDIASPCITRWVRDPVDDAQPDIEWVRVALSKYVHPIEPMEAFAILRPTSPFRTAATIRRAFKQFSHHEVHSIRAVQPVREHPGKMWQILNGCIHPLIREAWPTPMKDMHPLLTRDDEPWHSMPTQRLPQVFVQNASLEMAWTYVVKAFGTISGIKISPFFTEGYEGFDINDEVDFAEAERIVAAHPEMIPHVHTQTET